MFRTMSRGQLRFDVGVPSGLFVLLAIPYWALFAPTGGPTVLLGMCASLVFWRLNPAFSLAIAWATALLQIGFGQGADPTNIAIFVVLYATTAYGGRAVKWLGFASSFVGAAIIAFYTVVLPRAILDPGYYAPTPQGTADYVRAVLIVFFTFLGLFLLSWTAGLLAKTYRGAVQSRTAQAAAEVQKQRAEEDVMVEQERTRIARDMHDVVAHSLAVVIAQADGARYARVSDPDALDDALTTISATAREALADVRILLGQLRHNQVEGPQPVLDDLASLFDQMRAAGLVVEDRVHGERGPLGTGQQLAVYRIVQEALTNALRHGDLSEPVTVHFAWRSDAVALEISNAATPRTGDVLRPGHGVAGMRERATLVGGALDAAFHGNSFVVSATVPRVPGHTGALPVVPLESVS